MIDPSLALYSVLQSATIAGEPRSYLEIGTREGNSLSTVLKYDWMKRIQRVACCDNWGSSYGGTGRGGHVHIEALLNEIGYAGAIEFHDGDSKETVPKIEGLFDLILVDGDHSYEGASADMENSWSKLAPGGYMVIDDLIHPAHSYLCGLVDRFEESHSDSILIIKDIKKPHGAALIKKSN